jgi:DNA-binding NarL/FixJ family response regulator
MQRLVIVADRPPVIQFVRLALRNTAGFRVLGSIDGRPSIEPVLVEARPDVVIVDEMSCFDDALARVREIAEQLPDCHIVLLASDMRSERLAAAIEAGVETVIVKGLHPVSLGTLIRETTRGSVYHRMPRELEASEAGPPLPSPLTQRELEILRLVVEGGSNGGIARKLWVSEQTVKFHLSNIYRKLGVANRTEATHYAHTMHLLDRERLAFLAARGRPTASTAYSGSARAPIA